MTRPRALFLFISLLVVALAAACVPPGPAPGPSNSNANSNAPAASGTKPALAVSPAKQDQDWLVADADTVTVSATAPGAESVNLLYRPTFADEGAYVRLKNGLKAADAASGKFTTDLKLPDDFAGDVWVEVAYKDGQKAESDKLALRRSSQAPETGAGEPAGSAANFSPDVSARSDKVTGGTIQKAEIAKGGPDLRITINVPAFQLTLWQGDKEVQTYPIAVGRKEYPLPSGHRTAREIVLNPDWVPPDSDWVREEKVEPGEPIEAGDPKNPLGDVKIPLGDGILIHEAKPSDLGKLVSHGCARMVEKDLVDLVEKIATAQDLQLTPDELKKIIATDERKNVGLKKPIAVDVSYDTAVVEGGKLHVYSDVYGQKTDQAGEVRNTLAESGVPGERLDDATIKAMLDRVDRSHMFVVDVAAVKAGQAASAGKAEPVIAQAPGSPAKTKGKSKRG
jgi:lipoprotein-anchoring transpeptidase ErfK/SrfK